MNKKNESKELTINLGLTDKAIDEMEKLYLPLKLQGPDDKDGFKKIVEYRKLIKGNRVAITKAHKEGKANALEACRKWDSEKNRLLSRIEPIETHLIEQENIVKEEEKRKKEAKQKAIEEKNQKRIQSVIESGALFNGLKYVYGENELSQNEIINFEDSEFETVIDKIRLWKIEFEKKAEEQRQIEIKERERQAEIEAKQKAEQERLDKIKAEQEEAQAKIDEANAKIEAEKQRIEKEKEIAEAEARAKIEAEAKAEREKKEAEERHQRELKEAEGKAKREAEEKEEARIKAELKAKKDAERKARLAPDKEKIVAYKNALLGINKPDLKSPESKEYFEPLYNAIQSAINSI